MSDAAGDATAREAGTDDVGARSPPEGGATARRQRGTLATQPLPRSRTSALIEWVHAAGLHGVHRAHEGDVAALDHLAQDDALLEDRLDRAAHVDLRHAPRRRPGSSLQRSRDGVLLIMDSQ